MKISLNLDTDLMVNDSNRLTVKISPDEGNTLVVKSDGLYAAAPKGNSGGTGTGYPDTETIRDGVRIGYNNPFTNDKTSTRVVLTNTIHRIYEAEDHEGKVLKDYRPKIDCVLAGDMYRVINEDSTYSYYLITFTSSTMNGLGNQILSSIYLGSW